MADNGEETTRVMDDLGRLHPFTLRFLDDHLENQFQFDEGDKGRPGFRISALAAVLLWGVAAWVLPMTTDIPAATAWYSAGTMSAVAFAVFVFGRNAPTVDRQHFAIASLTVGQGVVLIVLAVSARAFEGYAVAAIMLLYVFGFVAGTRFVFALGRTVAVTVAYFIAVAVYDADRSLALDIFLLLTISAAGLLALRRSESDRRRVYYQQLVITEQSEELALEKEETDRLLLNILPASISARLKRGESPIADAFPSVSVLFADLEGFTRYASRLPVTEVIGMLSGLFLEFDDLVAERGLEKIKTIGDAYMVVGGMPEPLEDHAVLTVDLGLAMIEASRKVTGETGLGLRVGVHCGPVAGGVIGSRKFAYDVWGNTVNMAQRLENAGVPGRVQVSEKVRDLTQGRFDFESRGHIELPGLGPVNAYLVGKAPGRDFGP